MVVVHRVSRGLRFAVEPPRVVTGLWVTKHSNVDHILMFLRMTMTDAHKTTQRRSSPWRVECVWVLPFSASF
jgi:hypothetical protein